MRRKVDETAENSGEDIADNAEDDKDLDEEDDWVESGSATADENLKPRLKAKKSKPIPDAQPPDRHPLSPRPSTNIATGGGTSRTIIGRVRAVSDGVLRLKTNKRSDPAKFLNWSKQRCALSFEAKRLDINWAALRDTSPPGGPSAALAQARAAQILAEMLGMVCHPEYFSDPPRDQTVRFSYFPGWFG
jgi:hypothetical protein